MLPVAYSKIAQRKFSDRQRARIEEVYTHYPELHDKVIFCGAISGRGSIQGIATSWPTPPVFRLRPQASYYTIAHELTHLVQGPLSGIPHGEVACDMWTVDRMPAVYLDQPPYYLLGNMIVDWPSKKNQIKDLCRQAIDLRSTMHAYIVWLKNSVRRHCTR